MCRKFCLFSISFAFDLLMLFYAVNKVNFCFTLRIIIWSSDPNLVAQKIGFEIQLTVSVAGFERGHRFGKYGR